MGTFVEDDFIRERERWRDGEMEREQKREQEREQEVSDTFFLKIFQFFYRDFK